jgi:hypothetical protein
LINISANQYAIHPVWLVMEIKLPIVYRVILSDFI